MHVWRFLIATVTDEYANNNFSNSAKQNKMASRYTNWTVAE